MGRRGEDGEEEGGEEGGWRWGGEKENSTEVTNKAHGLTSSTYRLLETLRWTRR